MESSDYCGAVYRAAEAAICLMDFNAGRVLYEEYLRKCGETPGAWHGLAICLERLGDGEGSRSAYKRALELHLRDGDARNLLWASWCALKLGMLNEAYELIRKSLSLDPGYAYSWHTLALIAMKLGRRDEANEAMARYREVLSRAPYDRRECEGLRMLLDVAKYLVRVGGDVARAVRELLVKGLRYNRAISCNIEVPGDLLNA
ncbi:tetratricopeptide repeat protein [Vulcanisaeta thermophila]|uniref:tetratricopeptide repeat protein n=1 Tax=Vulcanisaeta thermophila TaxID=867917 RepID=UPI0008528EF3|nr:hypothetical protein [Vulcanisaeta thermophila]